MRLTARVFSEWWEFEFINSYIARTGGKPCEDVKWAAKRSWDAALTTWAQCYCGDAYPAEKDLHSYIVITETGYCPNCIAMEMREYKK